jgi:hypothetical protein
LVISVRSASSVGRTPSGPGVWKQDPGEAHLPPVGVGQAGEQFGRPLHRLGGTFEVSALAEHVGQHAVGRDVRHVTGHPGLLNDGVRTLHVQQRLLDVT